MIPLLSYGQEFVSVCDRTPQVKDAIMKQVYEIDENIECSDDKLIPPILSDITILNLERGGYSRIEAIFGRTIYSLKEGDFSGLSSLRVLNLSDNRLSGKSLFRIPGHILAGGGNLLAEALEPGSITRAREKRIPESVFYGLSSLEVLDLSYNELEVLSMEIFSDLPSLKSLLITGNRLSDETLLSVKVYSKSRGIKVDLPYL